MFDTFLRASDDVCTPSLLRYFRHQLSQREVAGVHLAPPCSSFSLSQSRGGRPSRSKQHPIGLPRLTETEKARVKDGNRTARATADIAALALSQGLPVAIENPATSYFWHMSEMQPILACGVKINLHMCAFGASWRKHTTVFFANF